jgi:hypothetical protein
MHMYFKKYLNNEVDKVKRGVVMNSLELSLRI